PRVSRRGDAVALRGGEPLGRGSPLHRLGGGPMNEVRSARRVRLLAILVLIAAFTAGALVGVAADRTVTGVRATPSRPALFRGADPPARSAPRIFAPGLVERLDL